MAVAITQRANPASVACVSDVTSYPGVAIGTASAHRIIAVVITKEVTAAVPTGVTIGGIAAAFQDGITFGNTGAWIYSAPVPTGDTATIDVTWSVAAFAANLSQITVYEVTGAKDVKASSANDTSTDMDASSPLSAAITIPANGAALAVAAGSTGTNAKAWANITEDLDQATGAFRHTTAMRTTAGSVTITCTGTANGEDGSLAVVVFAEGSFSIGSGALASGASVIDGDGTVESAPITGTGSLDADAATLDGEGVGSSSGTGTSSSAAATLDGEGVGSSSGTGTLSSAAATLDGEGVVETGAVTGTGSLGPEVAIVDGSGVSSSTGTGSLSDQAATVDGSGVSSSIGTGSLTDQAAVIESSGVSSSIGSGELVAFASTVVGFSEEVISGVGNLLATAATASGSGTSTSIGTGELTAASAVVDGVGNSVTSGSASLDASFSGLGGTGLSESNGTGVLVSGLSVVGGTDLEPVLIPAPSLPTTFQPIQSSNAGFLGARHRVRLRRSSMKIRRPSFIRRR